MPKNTIFLISFVFVLAVALVDTVEAELVGWWRFDKGSGNIAADSSRNGNDGAFNGDPQWVPGYFGYALEFDGSGDWLDCGEDPSLQIADAVTISVWVKVVAQGLDHKIGGNQDGANGGYKMTIYSNNKVEFEIRTSGNSAVLNRNVSGGTELELDVWYHLTGVYSFENGYIRTYVNGVLDRELSTTEALGVSTGSFKIGCEPFTTGSYNFNGIMDDLRIYNHALTEGEILGVMEGSEGWPYALSPKPEDGALYMDTWVSLGWQAGDLAVSHDVYFGDNFDDVNAGAESTFQGNQVSTFYVIGFPGFPFPEGLISGTTYYWRIDEVNDSEPNSPWKGDIWSFSIAPKTAYNPNPADGAKFIDPDTDLRWTAGFGTKLHTVYFGKNFDDVNNAAGGPPQPDTTYVLDTLELDRTYYWRVDEFDAFDTYKGNVWSFTTAGAGGGVRADYYQGMNFDSPALARLDPQIDFNWGGSEPDPSVGADDFSVRWTGDLEIPFTETYTFYTNSDDGVRLWVDGQQLVNNWTDHSATENKGTIDLVAGNTYSLVMEFYENAGDAVAELRWSSPSTPKQLIPQAALSPPVKAGQANPANGALDVRQTTILNWSPGETAASHDVYFGTDMDAVRNADTASPEYKGSRNLGSESYDPGKLQWNTTYYWRIDEVEDGGTMHTGNIWSFTTADFLIIDDMELYNDLNPDLPGSNRIYLAWVDGYDNPSTNGSVVGYTSPPLVEQTIVHSGNQSMPFSYDNAVGKSEATLTLTDMRNWTENGVDTLVIWYIGDAVNNPETMYIVLNDTSGVDNPNANAAQVEEWTQWTINLQQFNVNLTNVNTITLGFGNRTNPTAGGLGMVFFDDIRLYRPAP
jgi:hypothetical protein